MEALLVLQIIVVTMMVVVILMQHSSSDGFTGSGASTGGLMTGRGQANLLSKTTKILATIFLVNSLALAFISSNAKHETTVIDDIIQTESITSQEDAATEGEAVKDAIENEMIEVPTGVEDSAPVVPLSE
jgi:preprotein translocase subunit SecG